MQPKAHRESAPNGNNQNSVHPALGRLTAKNTQPEPFLPSLHPRPLISLNPFYRKPPNRLWVGDLNPAPPLNPISPKPLTAFAGA